MDMTALDPGGMPALYLGHGAPPLLDDPVWSGQLAAWAAGLPRPTAILIVSAHWEAAPVSLSASGAPLVYDFGGFDAKYYRMTYATPDATALAERLRRLGRRRAGPRRRRRARGVPLEGTGHALRPPDRGALHPAVHHPR